MSIYRAEGVVVWGARDDGYEWLECMAASPQGAERICAALNAQGEAPRATRTDTTAVRRVPGGERACDLGCLRGEP
jgi:hypothetical protein